MRWHTPAALFRSASAGFLLACLSLSPLQAAPGTSIFDDSSAAASKSFTPHLRTLEAAVPALCPGTLVPSLPQGRISSAGLLEEAHYAAAQNHHSLSYDGAREEMFSYTDNVVFDGVHGVIGGYSWVFVPGTSGHGGNYREDGDQNRDGYVDSKGMNAEHIWPQSFFKKRLPMRSDLHHLMPTFMHPNSVRGRLPLGEVPDGSEDYRTSAGAKRGGGVFEPPDMVKGRVARALLYFYTRYLGTNILPSSFVRDFWNSRIELILRWNREFPADDWERERNSRVEAVQGNRNPYVDDPSLADRIGADAFRMPVGSGLYANSGPSPRAPGRAAGPAGLDTCAAGRCRAPKAPLAGL